MQLPPVVYVGPSLDPQRVCECLPEAQIMPPIRRGDLYRDRTLGFSLFLILDGVFFNEFAIAPREIIDVLRDGGNIVGASSMGAIRAAECWPAGMRGVGSIYRLYRRGSLKSDDEVALVFNDELPHLVVSVPLINVRYALSKAIRDKILSKAQAAGAVSAAAEIFYADRTWRRILTDAGIGDEDRRLAKRLQKYDLKRADAIRACRAVATMIATDSASLLMPRTSRQLFTPSEQIRERSVEVTGSTVENDLKRSVCLWLAVSGRYRRFTLALPGGRDDERMNSDSLRNDLVGQEPDAVNALWERLEAEGELQASIRQRQAVLGAAAEARKHAWVPTEAHRDVARSEIAGAHGYADWQNFTNGINSVGEISSYVKSYAEELALAKRFREEAFASKDLINND